MLQREREIIEREIFYSPAVISSPGRRMEQVNSAATSPFLSDSLVRRRNETGRGDNGELL